MAVRCVHIQYPGSYTVSTTQYTDTQCTGCTLTYSNIKMLKLCPQEFYKKFPVSHEVTLEHGSKPVCFQTFVHQLSTGKLDLALTCIRPGRIALPQSKMPSIVHSSNIGPIPTHYLTFYVPRKCVK